MPKSLIPGLEFAKKHSLTPKEIIVLIPFLNGPHTTADIADKFGVPKNPLHHDVMRLKLKHLLILKDKDKTGNNIYEFNKEQLKK